MQVPEKLALIGGSILLSSTLVFTLKSQASSILPKVAHPISTIDDVTEDTEARHGNGFDKQWYQAKQDGDQVGYWGTAKYYIDHDNVMYVGPGDLQGRIPDAISTHSANELNGLKIADTVKAPQNSGGLFRDLTKIQGIDGLNNVDVSNVNDMGWMFHLDNNLRSLDLSSWHVNDKVFMPSMFAEDLKLQSVNLQNFSNKNGNFDNGSFFLHNFALSKITIGPNTSLEYTGLDKNSSWTNGSQTLTADQLTNGKDGVTSGYTSNDAVHPGTWTKQ